MVLLQEGGTRSQARVAIMGAWYDSQTGSSARTRYQTLVTTHMHCVVLPVALRPSTKRRSP